MCRGQKSKHFWPPVKPFLSNKCQQKQSDIILVENDKIINNTQEVCNVFNGHFSTVADGIGQDTVFDEQDHLSIHHIKEHMGESSDTFEFKPVSKENVGKIISQIRSNKSTGFNAISSKLLKAGSPVLTNHITVLVNNTLSTGIFPSELKKAKLCQFTKK